MTTSVLLMVVLFFVFAVLAEEMGLVFTLIVIFTFFFVVWRTFMIAHEAHNAGNEFPAYLAYGTGLILGIQAFVNMGVNVGLLPTKGLTLPLVSYGSNSLLVSCLLVAIVLRVEYECRNTRETKIPEPVMNYAA